MKVYKDGALLSRNSYTCCSLCLSLSLNEESVNDFCLQVQNKKCRRDFFKALSLAQANLDSTALYMYMYTHIVLC